MTKQIEFGIKGGEEVTDLTGLKDVKSIKDIPSFDYNPFTDNFKYSKKKYYEKLDNVELKVQETIITSKMLAKENMILAEKLYRDNEPFCKVFTRQEIFDVELLNPHTCKILLYLMYENSNLNIDFIIINIKTFSDKLGMSVTTVYSSIVELVNNLILVRKTNEDTIYWINPYIFFKGDRKKIKFRKLN